MMDTSLVVAIADAGSLQEAQAALVRAALVQVEEHLLLLHLDRADSSLQVDEEQYQGLLAQQTQLQAALQKLTAATSGKV